MRTIFSLVLIVVAITSFAQDTTRRTKVDSLYNATQNEAKAKTGIDSVKFEIARLSLEANRAKAFLNDVRNNVEKKKKIQDSLKNVIDSLAGVKKTAEIKLQTYSDKFQTDSLHADSLKKAIDRQLKELDSLKSANKNIDSVNGTLLDKRNQLIADAVNAEDSSEVIANFILKDTTLAVYTSSFGKIKDPDLLDNLRDEVDSSLPFIQKIKNFDRTRSDSNLYFKKIFVESARIDIDEGLMNEIIIKTNIGTFRNKDAPIDLVHFKEKRARDELYLEGDKSKYFIFLGNILDYEVLKSYNDIPYTQTNITLTPGQGRIKQIKESTSINSYFNVAVFTDIKGISGEANGLAQINASAKFITNTVNKINTAFIKFNFLTFNGGLAKFDNKFTGTKLDTSIGSNKPDSIN